MRLPLVRFVVMLALPLLVVPLTAKAQQVGKVSRIGYLTLNTAEGAKRGVDVLRAELRALGYVEGHNLVIEQRYAAGRFERLPELAAELLRLPIDILVVCGACLPLGQELPRTLPIVFTGVPDPVGQGLVASLAHPGGNLTGLSDIHADLLPKRLEFLKEVIPAGARVVILGNPNNPVTVQQWHIIQAAAPALGLTVLPLGVTGPAPDDIDSALATIAKERPEAIAVIGEPTVGAHRRRIAEFAVQHRLPTIGTYRSWAEGGFLMSYGATVDELSRRVATYVDKILKGAKPADLPVEQPTKFKFVINLKTAQALGLTMPPSLLFQADEVIR